MYTVHTVLENILPPHLSNLRNLKDEIIDSLSLTKNITFKLLDNIITQIIIVRLMNNKVLLFLEEQIATFFY